MAGFFSSPGLGFASGVGAFIGGAAKQINENIDEQRKQDRQDDILWLNRFERGRAEYDKEKETKAKQAQLYNSLLDLSKGNKKLADLGFNAVLANPKEGYAAAVSTILAHKDNPDFAQGEDYQSTVMSNMQENLNSKYNNLQKMYDTVRPQARKFMDLPANHNAGNQPFTSGGSQTLAAPMGDKLAGSGPSGAPQVPQVGPTNYSQGPNGQPDPLINENTNPSLNDQITKAPNAGEISLDTPNVQPAANTQVAQAPGTSPQGYPIPPKVQQSPLQVPTQQNPAAGGYGFGAGQKPPPFVLTKPETQRQAEQTDIARQHLDLEKQKFDFQQRTKPMDQKELADLDYQKKFALDYTDNAKTGVNARYAQLHDLQAQNKDITSMIGQLNEGLKASAVQGVYDNLNAFTSGLLGLDLKSVGIQANSYDDVTLLRKSIANAMIDRLKTLHFGRITNYTESIVQQGMASTNNTPNTNIKIALALQNEVRSAMELVQLEKHTLLTQGLDANNRPTINSAFLAQRAAEQFNNEYVEKNRNAPWPQYEGVTKDTLPLIAELRPYTWFESGKEKGRMIRFLGVQNGNIILKDAENRQVFIPYQGQ